MADDEAPPEMKEEVSELAPFDPTKKKKKKKVVLQDATDEGAEKATEKMESLSVSDTLTGLKKKKKKPVEGSFQEEENIEPIEDANGNHEDEDEGGEETCFQIRYPWEGSDRDYKYEELLGRVFNILRENNPELAGDRRRTVMRPPQVLREGTKKTVFVNFMDLCKT
ncbi:eukaryotic translation initiation factor 2 subunit beta isoform X2 [Cryptomeria japonica]|nr:eukaryotic translation initiation factor 2 subunit beta isoform X2 [Cryptomeria japonica]